MTAFTPLPGPETDAIHAVIEDYLHGIHEGDLARLQRAFAPGAHLHGDVGNQPTVRPLDEYLEVVRNRVSPARRREPFRMRLVALHRLGGIATAYLHCPMLGHDYHDMLALHRTPDGWRIVNKLFTDSPSSAHSPS